MELNIFRFSLLPKRFRESNHQPCDHLLCFLGQKYYNIFDQGLFIADFQNYNMKYKQHTVSNPKYPPSLLAYPSTHSPSRPVPLNHSANLPKRRNIQTDKTTAKEQVNMLHFLLPFSLQLSRTAAKLRRISEQIM